MLRGRREIKGIISTPSTTKIIRTIAKLIVSPVFLPLIQLKNDVKYSMLVVGGES